MLRLWAGRFSLIPLGVYALGTPVELLVRGDVTLLRDGWLPFEVMGLVVSLSVAVWWLS